MTHANMSLPWCKFAKTPLKTRSSDPAQAHADAILKTSLAGLRRVELHKALLTLLSYLFFLPASCSTICCSTDETTKDYFRFFLKSLQEDPVAFQIYVQASRPQDEEVDQSTLPLPPAPVWTREVSGSGSNVRHCQCHVVKL